MINTHQKAAQIFMKMLTFTAVLLVGACTETHSGAVSRGDAEGLVRQAHAVYKSRGFSDAATASLISNSDAFWTLPEEEANLLLHELGLAERGVNDFYNPPLEYYDRDTTDMVYSKFEPDTGAPIDRSDMVGYASRAASCFAGGEPWKDCTLNYHPVDGCFLEGKVLQECKRVSRIMSSGGALQGGDGEKCWNYAKGPAVHLPYQAETQSQIQLAQVAAATPTPTASTQSAPVRVNALNRPVCTSAFSNGPATCDPVTGC
jgi:hypothetical protein